MGLLFQTGLAPCWCVVIHVNSLQHPNVKVVCCYVVGHDTIEVELRGLRVASMMMRTLCELCVFAYRGVIILTRCQHRPQLPHKLLGRGPLLPVGQQTPPCQALW